MTALQTRDRRETARAGPVAPRGLAGQPPPRRDGGSDPGHDLLVPRGRRRGTLERVHQLQNPPSGQHREQRRLSEILLRGAEERSSLRQHAISAGKEESEPAPAAPVAPASSVDKRVWLAKPVASAPRGERQTRSGASVFADGVGFVTFRNAVTQVDEVAAAAPEKAVALKDARSVGSGGVAFSGAGSGSASWQRPAAAVNPPVSEGAAPTKEDFATVAVWVACGLLLAFKLLINPA